MPRYKRYTPLPGDSTMTKDHAASIRARLLAIAKSQNIDFNQILIRFALERVLYRLMAMASTISSRLLKLQGVCFLSSFSSNFFIRLGMYFATEK